MKIAHLVTSNTFAGIEQHVFELVKVMQNEISLVILCEPFLQDHMHGVKTEKMKMGSRYSFINVIKLKQYIKKNNIDLLHCHGAKASTIGNWVKLTSNIKLVSTIHGYKSNNSSFKQSDAVIGVNKELIKNIPSGTFIPNWYNPNHRGDCSLRTGPIIAVGRLEKVKGFDNLIKSWVNIQEKLQIIGSGPEQNRLQALITSLNLSNRIEIITNCSYAKIEEKYKIASGLVISSLREGGPRVLLEAINHEIPVIGTKVGILPQLISKELLAEPNNQLSLQSLLEEMVPLLPQLNVSALKVAISKDFSIENASKKTKETYLSLLSDCS